MLFSYYLRSLSNSLIAFNILVAIYFPVWLCRSVWKDFQIIGLGWLTTMGLLRMLLHPSHINLNESDAVIFATVSTLFYHIQSEAKALISCTCLAQCKLVESR